MAAVDFAGIRVDNVSLNEAAEIIQHYIAEGKPRLVVTPNPEIIVAAQSDNELKSIINSADLRVADGISMVVVSKILGNPLKERVAGIDLMLKIIEMSARRNRNLFLLGGAPGVAEEAAAQLVRQYPGINIVGTHQGYFKQDIRVIQAIKDTKPDILFIGLGAGKQEKWIYRCLRELNVPVAMVVGGSLDIISGKKQRAPRWIQRLYIEWLYRLITEPDRWKRQLALPKFLWLVFSRGPRYNIF